VRTASGSLARRCGSGCRDHRASCPATRTAASCQTTLRDESADLILLPVWVVALRYHRASHWSASWSTARPEGVGVTPLSWLKLALIAAAIAGLARLLVSSAAAVTSTVLPSLFEPVRGRRLAVRVCGAAAPRQS
jgi:hypothetical protein